MNGLKVFNFSSSYSGGGLKRLVEFSKFYNENGGAVFILHNNAEPYVNDYKNNKYYYIKKSAFQRFFNYEPQLLALLKRLGGISLYYAYGVPISFRIDADVVVLHISNVLPFVGNVKQYGYGFFMKMRFLILRRYLLESLKFATHLSAESKYSLRLLRGLHSCAELLSVNGSDDEIEYCSSSKNDVCSNYAIVLGTHCHKNLLGSYAVFKWLKGKNDSLRLKIIGSRSLIPSDIVQDTSVECLGILERRDVIELLKYSKYYISTTLLENSFNAASEGVFFAKESFISNIEPHNELLAGSRSNLVDIDGAGVGMLNVVRDHVNVFNLKSWNLIVTEVDSLV